MPADPRINLSGTLHGLLSELVALQQKRGKKATISGVGAEILSEWLPAYIANEKAIERGEGSCVGAMINWGVAPRPQVQAAANPRPQSQQSSTNTPAAEPVKKERGNRDKLQAFLSH